MRNNNSEVRSVTVAWQSEAEAPGNSGWAYWIKYRDGREESGEVSVDGADGSEALSTVIEAALAAGLEIPTGVWASPRPDGNGWRWSVPAPVGYSV